MSEKDDRLPFDETMCMEQFAQTVGFVAAMQGDGRIEDACSEAERRCAELFEQFYAADDRTAFLEMLGYLAMDITVNVAYTLDRIAIAGDMG